MQRCPNCGNSLPDKASSCARCGRQFTAPGDLAPSQQKAQPFSAIPNNAGMQEPPVSLPGGQAPLPVNSAIPMGKPPVSPAPKTPLPVGAGMIAATETVEVKAPTQAPLPPQGSPPVQAKQAPQPSPMPPMSAPQGPQNRAGQPPTRPNTARPEDQRAVAVRTSSPRPMSTNRPGMNGQRPPAGPPGPRAPQGRPGPGPNPNSQRTMIEAQPTMRVPSMNRPPTRNGPPGPGYQPSAQYNTNTALNYRGNTAARMRALPPAPPKPAPKGVRATGGLLWRLVSPIFSRALDSEPERLAKPLPRSSLLGWLPVLAVSSALGLFTATVAFNASRNLIPGAELYYWLGIALIYLPIVVRLIMPHASRAERFSLLCVATICLFLTKVSLSPLYYSGYDEFLHWRSINDILSTNHLLTKNALLPVSPFYPGLEITASALSAVSGMTSIQAGFTVVGAACLLMVLSLFLIGEMLSGSARLGSIAAIIFMANPHFLFFDTQFAYESLALPLATVVMLAMVRYEVFKQHRPWIMIVAWTVLLAMDLTHHATNFVFEGLFLLWFIVYLFIRPQPLRKSIVIWTFPLGVLLTVGTVLAIGGIVIGYFTSFFADVSAQVAKSLGSSNGPQHQLFGGAGVIPTPLWERLISLGSVGLITLAIPFLLICFWRRYRRNSLAWVFAIIVVFYPVLQVLRLTTSGAEISDRTSPFIFIALGFLGAVAIVQFWPVRLLNWKHAAIISGTLLVLFMGGVILGEGIPPAFMPGTYEASADARSIDPESIQAALWANLYLGPNNRMYTDRVNQLLMGVYGDQYLVTQIGDNIDITDVIFDANFTKYDISLLQKGQVHYLSIDLRLSTLYPQDGFYYEQGEPVPTDAKGDIIPIPQVCLTKFNGVPQINRLFDSGDIAIYDTGGLINAPQIP